jgi:hypothetical protein
MLPKGFRCEEPFSAANRRGEWLCFLASNEGPWSRGSFGVGSKNPSGADFQDFHS